LLSKLGDYIKERDEAYDKKQAAVNIKHLERARAKAKKERDDGF